MVNLLERADRIAERISTSDIAVRYWQARRKMESHAQAQALFERLKLKRNHSLILRQQVSADHPKVLLADLEVREIEQALEQVPVAIQYQEAQDELNELLSGVVELLISRVKHEIPVERGPRQGCGQGHDGNGCSCGDA